MLLSSYEEKYGDLPEVELWMHFKRDFCISGEAAVTIPYVAKSGRWHVSIEFGGKTTS